MVFHVVTLVFARVSHEPVVLVMVPLDVVILLDVVAILPGDVVISPVVEIVDGFCFIG